MSSEDNIKTIQSIYDAFGRGDIATILDGVAADVDWSADGTSEMVPWYGVRRSKPEVAAFFDQFGSTMEVREFTPLSFAANDTEVHTTVHLRAVSRATGKEVNQTLHHFFRFRDGKIAYYRGSEDSAQVDAALRP